MGRARKKSLLSTTKRSSWKGPERDRSRIRVAFLGMHIEPIDYGRPEIDRYPVCFRINVSDLPRFWLAVDNAQDQGNCCRI
jgi:hypothetical protein